MDEVQIFDDYLPRRNVRRRDDLSEALGDARHLFERHLRIVRAAANSAHDRIPKLPRIYSDLVIDPVFNAVAFSHRDRYFVAYHDGVPLILSMVINRFMADQSLFKTVGDVKNEEPNLPLYKDIVANAATILTSNSAFVQPKDQRRIEYAIHLCDLATNFLAVHEISHIANGHVDYGRPSSGSSYVDELEMASSSRIGNLQRQAMEYDADATASRMLVNTAKHYVTAHSQTSNLPSSFYGSPKQAMFDAAVAICIVFRLFQDSRVNSDELSTQCHPPTRLRQYQILQLMGNCVAEFWDAALFDEMAGVFSSAMAEVEEAFELITGTPQQVAGLQDASSEEGWKYARAIIDCWNNEVRDKVAKCAYVAPNTYHFDAPTP